MDPNRSGVHTRRSSWRADRSLSSTSPVLRLKNRVPANWIAADHQVASRVGRSRVACSSSRPPAAVKKSEPMKKTQASARAPTSWTKPGNGPTRKQTEPIPKPAATQASDTGWTACRGAWISACPITPPILAQPRATRVTRYG